MRYSISACGLVCALCVAGAYALLQRDLPDPLVLHVTAGEQPDVFIGHGGFLAGALAMILAESVLLAVAMAHTTRRWATPWAMTILLLEAAVAVVWLLYNAAQTPLYLRLSTVAAVALGVTVVVGVLALLFQIEVGAHVRGPDEAAVIGTFQHRSAWTARIGAAFLLIPIGLLVILPDVWSRLTAAAGGAVGLWAALFLWRGFSYVITGRGIAIRYFPGRVRWIPRETITDWRARELSPLREYGGWGIRGFASNRAYILGGKTGLEVRTRSGTVLLGHDRPDVLASALALACTPEELR